jgi:hypothetical protein
VPRGGHIAAALAENNVERVGLRRVNDLKRNQRSDNPVCADYRRLPDALPRGEDVADSRVVSVNRDTSVTELDGHIRGDC